MTEKILRESVTEPPVKTGKRWRVIVARPGQGSSGNYSEEVFRRDAHKIIAPGGQAFINHDDSRNPKDMLGVYPEGSFWSEEDKAVVSELSVFSHWEAFVDEVGPHCGISLYALGEQDDQGNVTAFIEDRLNGADLVARPGLVGSGLAEKLYESAIAGSGKTTTTAVEERERNKMDEKVVEALEALTAQVASLVTDRKESVAAEAQTEADATAIAEALASFKAAVKAVDEAELLDVQRESILAAAERGDDVAPLIEQAVAIKKAAEESVTARLGESAPGREFGARKVESATELGKVFG